jgi:hypothetical protein
MICSAAVQLQRRVELFFEMYFVYVLYSEKAKLDTESNLLKMNDTVIGISFEIIVRV